jgi:hypothetical protein
LDKQYKSSNESFYNFEYENKHIYYHELSDILLGEKYKADDIFWGTAIDLFDNPVGDLTVLQFFRLKALQNCVF